MEKYVVKNEQGEFTAVLYTPSFGRGYSTWGYGEPMDGELISSILENVDDFNPNEVNEDTEIDVSDYVPNFSGELCYIAFIRVGTLFKISEYDGSEKIEIFYPENFYTA